jgi:hypothetical protein
VRRLDVDDHRLRAQVAHHLGGGGEGEGRHDHLVAGADAQAFQRQVQAGGGGIDGDRLHLAAQVGLEILLELARGRPGRDPARAQAGDHGVDLGLVDVGQGEGQEGRSFGCMRGGRRGGGSDGSVAAMTAVGVQVFSHG